MVTGTTPASADPSARAAAKERSMIRPATNGPRSFTRTRMRRPVSRLMTTICVPSGSVLCAAVIAYML